MLYQNALSKGIRLTYSGLRDDEIQGVMEEQEKKRKEQIEKVEKQKKAYFKMKKWVVETKTDGKLFSLLTNRLNCGSGYTTLFEKTFKGAFEKGEVSQNDEKWIKVACKYGTLRDLRVVIDLQKPDFEVIRLTKEELNRALHAYPRPGDEGMVQTMLDYDALGPTNRTDINAVDVHGSTLLNTVVTIPERNHDGSENSLKMVKLLLANGAEVNKENDYEETPLHRAVKAGNVEISTLLLLAGGKTNVKATYRRVTPLMIAEERGHDDLVELLTAHSKSPKKIKEKERKVLISKACGETRKKIRKALSEKTALKETFLGCRPGDEEKILELLKKGVNVNAQNKTKDTLLSRMSGISERNDDGSEFSLTAVKILLENGASVTLKDSHRITPLHRAAEQGNIEMARLFIEKGADPLLKGGWDGKDTPLRRAERCYFKDRRQKMLDFLRSYGATSGD